MKKKNSVKEIANGYRKIIGLNREIPEDPRVHTLTVKLSLEQRNRLINFCDTKCCGKSSVIAHAVEMYLDIMEEGQPSK